MREGVVFVGDGREGGGMRERRGAAVAVAAVESIHCRGS